MTTNSETGRPQGRGSRLIEPSDYPPPPVNPVTAHARAQVTPKPVTAKGQGPGGIVLVVFAVLFAIVGTISQMSMVVGVTSGFATVCFVWAILFVLMSGVGRAR